LLFLQHDRLAGQSEKDSIPFLKDGTPEKMKILDGIFSALRRVYKFPGTYLFSIFSISFTMASAAIDGFLL
jgi:hypothetical protein